MCRRTGFSVSTKETADARAPLLGRIAAMKDEAEQAAATLRRLSSSIAELEKKV